MRWRTPTGALGGYIYSCREIVPCKDVDIRIPHAHISAQPAEICGCERVPDELEALLRAEEAGDIVLVRYPQFIARPENAGWLRRTIREEYAGAQPDYRFFLKRRFGALLE